MLDSYFTCVLRRKAHSTLLLCLLRRTNASLRIGSSIAHGLVCFLRLPRFKTPSPRTHRIRTTRAAPTAHRHRIQHTPTACIPYAVNTHFLPSLRRPPPYAAWFYTLTACRFTLSLFSWMDVLRVCAPRLPVGLRFAGFTLHRSLIRTVETSAWTRFEAARRFTWRKRNSPLDLLRLPTRSLGRHYACSAAYHPAFLSPFYLTFTPFYRRASRTLRTHAHLALRVGTSAWRLRTRSLTHRALFRSADSCLHAAQHCRARAICIYFPRRGRRPTITFTRLLPALVIYSPRPHTDTHAPSRAFTASLLVVYAPCTASAFPHTAIHGSLIGFGRFTFLLPDRSPRYRVWAPRPRTRTRMVSSNVVASMFDG